MEAISFEIEIRDIHWLEEPKIHSWTTTGVTRLLKGVDQDSMLWLWNKIQNKKRQSRNRRIVPPPKYFEYTNYASLVPRAPKSPDHYKNQQNQDIITIMEGIKHDANKWSNYSLKQGCLRHHESILLSKKSSIILKLLREFHDSILGGHSGFVCTYWWITQHIWWLGMKEWIQSHVSSYIICQKNKIVS